MLCGASGKSPQKGSLFLGSEITGLQLTIRLKAIPEEWLSGMLLGV